MTPHRHRDVIASVLLCIGAVRACIPMALHAQGSYPTVQAETALQFGVLAPAASDQHASTPASDAGTFVIRGTPGACVLLTIDTPVALSGPDATTIPITFGPGSAAAAPSRDQAAIIRFDPRAPFLTRLPASGEIVVQIEGTAHPGARLAPGAYLAVIHLDAVYTECD